MRLRDTIAFLVLRKGIEMELNPKDLTVEQIWNGSNWFPKCNGIRITHIPTDISVECTEGRSLHRNNYDAMVELKNRVELHYFYLKEGYIEESEQQKGLRALRLYHWKTAVKLREWAKTYEGYNPMSKTRVIQNKMKIYNEGSDFHMKQVQLLNEFFPPDDTAEKDSLK